MSSDTGGEWNRDAAYHPWIARIAAEHAGDVLDVGCGDGLLASRLAEVSRSVVGIDRDPIAVGQAEKRLRLVPNADAVVSELGTEWGLASEGYDVITLVSVLHELPLLPALERVVELLKPGGSLVIVGQALSETWLDRALLWASTPYTRVLQSFYAWRGMYRPEFASTRPAEPGFSFADVADAAAELLPGAELHRGLLRGYRLVWVKPVAIEGDGAEPVVASGVAGELGWGTAPTDEAEDAHLLAPDAVDELSHLFDQTREVPTIEPQYEPGQVRRSA